MDFAGNTKTGSSILFSAEQRFIRWMVPHMPRGIRSYHLTLMSIPFSIGIVLFGFLARQDSQWLWGISALIVLQWFTDSLDGALGKWRKEGLVRWGYYMDHFLDYIFLCSILISYSFILPDHLKFLHFFVLAIFGGYMVHSFLAVTATEEFRISYLGIGPTEIRALFILINTLIVVLGRTYMVTLLPYALLSSTFGLILVVYRTQKIIYLRDQSERMNDGQDKNEKVESEKL